MPIPGGEYYFHCTTYRFEDAVLIAGIAVDDDVRPGVGQEWVESVNPLLILANHYYALLVITINHYCQHLYIYNIYTYTCVYVYNVCLYLCVLYIYADWDVWSLLRFPVRTLWFQQCRPRCPGLGLGTGAGHMAEMGENSERRFHGTWILVTAWSIYVFLIFPSQPSSLYRKWRVNAPLIRIGEREREIYIYIWTGLKIRIQSLGLNKFPDGEDQGTQWNHWWCAFRCSVAFLGYGKMLSRAHWLTAPLIVILLWEIVKVTRDLWNGRRDSTYSTRWCKIFSSLGLAIIIYIEFFGIYIAIVNAAWFQLIQRGSNQLTGHRDF